MSSKTNPLEVPELVALVLEHIAKSGDSAQLVRCAQVNKIWAEEATSLRWECASLTHFSEHVSPARRPFYSRKVRELSVSGSADVQLLDDSGLDRNLLWPSLKELVAEEREHSRDDQLFQFLSPQLRGVWLYDGWASDNILSQLPALCTRLSSINLDDFTPNGVLSLLEASQSINAITLHQSDDTRDVISPQLSCHLANRKGLKTLQILKTIVWKDLPNSTWGSTSPFLDLVHADFTTEPVIIAHLLPYLRELAYLSVWFIYPTTDTLFCGAQCSKLTNLEIQFCRASIMDGRDLVNLAERCRGLQSIGFHSDHHNLIMNNLTDAIMERVASALQHLSIFEIFIVKGDNTVISIESMKSFGTHCRNLTRWDINLNFALQDIGQEGLCLFPKLEELGMNNIDDYKLAPNSEILQAIGPVVNHHFPCLDVLRGKNGQSIRTKTFRRKGSNGKLHP